MYKFLASTRWIGWLLMVLFFAAICAGLSWWQWDRRADVAQTNRLIEQNWNATPIELAPDSPWLESLPEDKQYTPVRLEGRYLSDQQLMVRMRSGNGRVGMEQLVPFETNDGVILAVDRGWMPNGDGPDQHPDNVPATPQGEASIVVRLVRGEPNIGRDAPAGQIASVDLVGAAQLTGLDIAPGAYGWLASEEPSVETPALLQEPSEDEGMHWSYALQWMAFGLLFFIGFGYAARQQAKINAERKQAQAAGATGVDGEGTSEPMFQARRVAQKKQRRPRRDGSAHDEDIEDAYLDAQGYEDETPLAEPQREDHTWMSDKT
ncbi:SURF1 family protein [Pseudoglutamicibacter albus]|uniref:SURF1 family cytochrome oxidase biogenesis protein n=1 Tax=Pseudoglutamicibacter albus TaxID=98671 RepID=UPI001EF5E604|nr:SURF1 family protein [Pseudoglutamicibacter albus]